jgi:DNA-binding transcriptional regulator YdaS (Cro superfamily)
MNAYDLNQVTQHFGSKKDLARALSIAPQAVYQWKVVPPRRALEIEKITKGLFKADRHPPTPSSCGGTCPTTE